MYPRVQGAPNHGTYYRASMFLSMTAQAQNKDLAAKFINFFVNDPSAGRILLVERGAPVASHIRSDIYQVVTPADRHVLDYLTKIGPFTGPADPPYPSGAGEIENPLMRNVMLEIMMKRVTPEAGLAQIVRESNAVLARMNQ